MRQFSGLEHNEYLRNREDFSVATGSDSYSEKQARNIYFLLTQRYQFSICASMC